MMMRRCAGMTVALLVVCHEAMALGQVRYVEATPERGSFAIVQGKAAATLYVDSNDSAGVVRAVGDLQADIARVIDARDIASPQRSRNTGVVGC